MQPKSYRPEIDGLRAIAVAGVVFDHVGIALFHSGFAGVDIFFVISGFLIGGIVSADLAAGRFSFADFYARRVRRILPALFVMILATVPFGLLLMAPQDLRYYGGGAVATLLFVSNIWFLSRIDYFDPAAAYDPLLHTWSLAVEEQFYLILPVLLLALWRFGPRLVWWVLAALAGLSLAYTLLFGAVWPMAGFYLGHTRAWELLAGVLAAQALPRLQAIGTAGLRGGLATLGLGMVLASVTLIPAGVQWPGAWTLLPVLGALLIVSFGAADGLGRRVLASRPFVAVGLVSYSAYLWHQPILGFLAVSDRPATTPLAQAAVIAATAVLAWLSWRYVETPFRHKSARPWTRRAALIAMALAIFGFGIGGHLTEGYPARMPPEVRALMEPVSGMPAEFRSCIGKGEAMGEVQPASACVHGAPNPAQVVVWGDSHSAVLVNALAQQLKAENLAVRELTLAGCTPVLGLFSADMAMYPYCADHNRRVFDYLLADQTVKLVILHAYWDYGIQRLAYDNGAGNVQTDYAYLTVAGAAPDLPDAARWAGIEAKLVEEITALRAAGKQVLLIGPVPPPGMRVPYVAAMQLWKTGTAADDISIPASAALGYSAPARDLLRAAAEQTGALFYDPAPLLCTSGRCFLRRAGVSLYFDNNHLSPPAADLVAKALLPGILAGLGRPAP